MMGATYAIGDLQGCFAPLLRLLDTVQFQPRRDRLWLAGDLVNRGPQSLELLQQVFHWQEAVQFVLGNHDLYALARWSKIATTKKSDTLGPLLAHRDVNEWMEWLRAGTLLHSDTELGWNMVHAALHPDWDLTTAKGHAEAVEDVLHGNRWRPFLKSLWAEPPPRRWQDCRNEVEAMRFRVAVFTRARLVTSAGLFSWPSQPAADGEVYLPWHTIFQERHPDTPLICGHWATQGLLVKPGLLALDSGCVWGRQLSAARIDMPEPVLYQVDCPAYARPDSA